MPLPESCCRGTQLLAFRAAAIEKWGDIGWTETCALLDDETRSVVMRPTRPIAWVPERYMVALADAVFAGPAAKSETVYREYVRHQVDLGFGRVRRALLHLAPPEMILKRAPDLWRHDHTHGKLVIDITGTRALVRIVNHLHATNDVANMTASEIFRYVLSLTRAKNVTSSYQRVAERDLEVLLEWQ